ncbi:MAG: LysM peptidoglycan-binding domain-containing protein [Lachnospiraceae bacterium]|nr:LysM peptidoglycan-binding domain-containing protein [Lachnospiraceae bacterium]
MKERYEGRAACTAAERGLYSPIYDDMLERRSSGSAGNCTRRSTDSRRGRSADCRKAGSTGSRKSVRKMGLSGTAGVYCRKKLLILLAAAVVLTFVFGAIGVHAVQKGVACSDEELAYKVITVERGDTLWDIAQACYRTTDDDIRTYINKIRDMNHIHGDNLKEGQLLLIYYGAPEAEEALEVAEK